MTGPDFDGETYDHDRDHERLTSQLARVRALMSDGKWRTISQISANTMDPEASVSARLRDLRKDKFGALEVQRREASENGLFEYRVVAPAGQASLSLPKVERPRMVKSNGVPALKALRELYVSATPEQKKGLAPLGRWLAWRFER